MKFDRSSLESFWQRHDDQLESHTALGSPDLTHDLYRGMPGWFNKFFNKYQNRSVRILMEHIAHEIDAPALDIGCGTGRWTEFLYGQRYQAFGFDIGEASLLHARQRLGMNRFIAGDLHHPPFGKEQFRLILSVTVLQHIRWEDQPDVIQRHANLLLPGGYFIILESIDTMDHSAYVFPNPISTWQDHFKSAGFRLVAAEGTEYVPIAKIPRMLRKATGRGELAKDSRSSVEQISSFLRLHPMYNAFLKLAMMCAYPLEVLASALMPKKNARLIGILFRKEP